MFHYQLQVRSVKEHASSSTSPAETRDVKQVVAKVPAKAQDGEIVTWPKTKKQLALKSLMNQNGSPDIKSPSHSISSDGKLSSVSFKLVSMGFSFLIVSLSGCKIG